MGIRVVDIEEGLKWEVGLVLEIEFGKVWCFEGRGEVGRGTELEEIIEK